MNDNNNKIENNNNNSNKIDKNNNENKIREIKIKYDKKRLASR